MTPADHVREVARALRCDGRRIDAARIESHVRLTEVPSGCRYVAEVLELLASDDASTRVIVRGAIRALRAQRARAA